jgi:hypothetical protein
MVQRLLETQERNHEERYRHRWYGKYRAFVRDNHDPERLGRCRLEIPAVLGTGEANWSDWAAPCFPYGGNEDLGMFLVPDEGASVWAEFEGGEVQYPIWSGVWLAKSDPGEQPEESTRLCDDATCLDCEDANEHAARAFDHKEHGKYAHQHPPYYCVRRRVLLKSETGHTFAVDDKDGEEFLEILDRVGQALVMEGRIKPNLQSGNSKPRGTRTAEAGDQYDIGADIVDAKARIEITDACRQFIRWEAWKDAEKIHIQSCDKSRSRWQKILLDTTKGREKVRILGLGGEQEIVIDGTSGSEAIRITDKAGQVIRMTAGSSPSISLEDAAGSVVKLESGNVSISSVGQVLINS